MSSLVQLDDGKVIVVRHILIVERVEKNPRTCRKGMPWQRCLHFLDLNAVWFQMISQQSSQTPGKMNQHMCSPKNMS